MEYYAEKISQSDFKRYRRYIEENITLISQISIELENGMHSLEKDAESIRKSIAAVKDKVELLNGFYFNNNSVKGREYLLKLRELLKEYEDGKLPRKIFFNTVHFVLRKMTKLRDESFNAFPEPEKSFYFKDAVKKNGGTIKKNTAKSDYTGDIRLFSFYRNNSWFIKPCVKIKIIAVTGDIDIQRTSAAVVYNKKEYVLNDILLNKRYTKPKYLVFLDDKECFAADETGSKYLSRKAVIGTMIKPLGVRSRIAKGYIRFYGRKHILLK
jgi:hypothetical protein